MTKQPNVVSTVSFALQSTVSLLRNIPDQIGLIYWPIYNINARAAEVIPLNVDEEILSHIMTAIHERGVERKLRFRPYWDRSLCYNAVEVFGAIIQFVDLHKAKLPKAVFPPAEDVTKFIDTVKADPLRTKIGTQLTIALDITHNDLLGAVNLCWAATRFMSRGVDQRAYPDISMDAGIIRRWNNEIAQFETYNNSGQNEGPGDTYYFWSHAFGAMVFSKRGLGASMAQLAFAHGTEIMAFARRYIARKPNITAHSPASELGRATGLTLAHLE